MSGETLVTLSVIAWLLILIIAGLAAIAADTRDYADDEYSTCVRCGAPMRVGADCCRRGD